MLFIIFIAPKTFNFDGHVHIICFDPFYIKSNRLTSLGKKNLCFKRGVQYTITLTG